MTGVQTCALPISSQFDKLAGIAQQRPVKPGSGWIDLYRARFPERIKQYPEQPGKHRWLGGEVSVLRQVLAKPN